MLPANRTNGVAVGVTAVVMVARRGGRGCERSSRREVVEARFAPPCGRRAERTGRPDAGQRPPREAAAWGGGCRASLCPLFVRPSRERRVPPPLDSLGVAEAARTVWARGAALTAGRADLAVNRAMRRALPLEAAVEDDACAVREGGRVHTVIEMPPT